MIDCKEILNKIYSMECNKDCEICKGDLQWCPKTYASDLDKAVYIMEHNLKICTDYIKKYNL